MPTQAPITPVTPESSTCDAGLVRVFAILGKRWNGVLLGTLAHGPNGFAELTRRIDGISDSVLSDRLGELQTVGLVVRRVAPGPPVTVTYCLSAAGETLLPALQALGAWASDHLEPHGGGAC